LKEESDEESNYLEEVGSDYDKPTIIVIKKLKMYSNLNDERTFSDFVL